MQISLVAHDIRSTHNVGAFFRTCDAFSIDEIIFSGYTPYPTLEDDSRLPHLSDKITRQIHKTALGAESTVPFVVFDNIDDVIESLKSKGYLLVALEQASNSTSLESTIDNIKKLPVTKSIALFVGNEIHGVNDDLLSKMDYIIELPSLGQKESLNVSVSAGIVLYELSKLKL
jgi:23S rRNA (guanosine2251-2'-O)-methyltransferase